MSSFDDFKIWVQNIQNKWSEQGIIFDKIVEINKEFSLMKFYIEVHIYDSFGEVRFYESNDIYWIEFESFARDFEYFYRYFEFDKYNLPDLSQAEQDYLNFLNKR